MNKNFGRNRWRTPSFMMMLLASTVLVFTSCDNSDEGVIEPTEVAYVSLYNASPDAPDLDIVVDARQISSFPFGYGDYTGYLRFFTGDRTLRFRPYNASNVALDTTVNFEDGEAYSVFLADEYSNLNVLVLDDGNEDAEEGMAMVRFVHLSPDAPAVNLAIEGENDAIVNDLMFMEGTDFMGIDPDNYDFEVRTADGNNVVLSIPDVELQEGWFYTVVAQGYDMPDAGNQNVLSARVIVN